MSVIQLKRGNAATAPATPAAGEPIAVLDDQELWIGTGTGKYRVGPAAATITAIQSSIAALTTSNAADNFIATGAAALAANGVDGDFHINVANGDITGPKATGAWPAAGNVGNAYSQLGLSTDAGADLGVGSVGVGTTAARSDHTHALPTLNALVPGTVAANQIVRRNAGNTAWEFTTIPSGVTTFAALSDTPAAFTGAGGQLAKVNAGATAIEFSDVLDGGTF